MYSLSILTSAVAVKFGPISKSFRKVLQYRALQKERERVLRSQLGNASAPLNMTMCDVDLLPSGVQSIPLSPL